VPSNVPIGQSIIAKPHKPVNCNLFSLWSFRFGADPITKSPLTQNKQMEMDIDPSLGMDLAAEGLWSDEESDHSFAASESDAEIAPPKKKVHIPIPVHCVRCPHCTFTSTSLYSCHLPSVHGRSRDSYLQHILTYASRAGAAEQNTRNPPLHKSNPSSPAQQPSMQQGTFNPPNPPSPKS